MACPKTGKSECHCNTTESSLTLNVDECIAACEGMAAITNSDVTGSCFCQPRGWEHSSMPSNMAVLNASERGASGMVVDKHSGK